MAHAQATLPSGGQVVAGAATISQSSANSLSINQTTDRATLNWQSFSIGAGNSVNIHEPSATSVQLDQVVGANPSQIFGQLTSNGRVILTNPNGIYFGATSQVDVAGLVASTAHASPNAVANFQAGGNLNLDQAGNANASVVNDGKVTVSQAGLAAFVAPGVRNDGVIQAKLGTVQLASGTTATLDFRGDGLINLAVNGQTMQAAVGPDGKPLGAAVTNTGKIVANGGTVELTADVASGVVDQVINAGGVVQARSVSRQNGEIVLDGGTSGGVVVAGTLDASGKGAGQTGGTVEVLGQNVKLTSKAKIDVSGNAGGGTALIGGNFHGAGPQHNATTTKIAKGAVINANAIKSGNGGKVAVWSNQSTSVAGTITATGGAQSGNGGSVETSGESLTVAKSAIVNASAPHGQAGNWLLDPGNVTIENSAGSGSTGSPTFQPTSGTADAIVDASDLETALDGGTSVTVTTTNSGADGGVTSANIEVNAPITWNSGANSTTLTLNAADNIGVNAAISGTANAGQTASLVMNATSGNVAIGAAISLTGSLEIVAGRSISESSGAITVGTLTGSAGGGSISLNSATNSIASVGSLAASGGGITLFSHASLILDGPITGDNVSIEVNVAGGTLQLGSNSSGANLSATASSSPGVSLVADNITEGSAASTIAATDGSNGGTVEIAPYSSGRAVSLEGTASGSTLLIDSTLLGDIGTGTGGTLRIGGYGGVGGGLVTTSAGNISVDGAVNLTGLASTLELDSNGTQSEGSGSLDVGTLTGSAGGTVTLSAAANDIATLGTFGVSGGSFTLADAGNTGKLAVSGPLSATDITIDNANTGTIGVSSGINATGSLTLSSGSGGIVLGGGTMQTGTGQTYSGAVTLGANTTVNASGGNAIVFDSTVDSASGQNNNLISLSGNVTFGGAVGGITRLALVQVDGNTTINGGTVATSGGQFYEGRATLGADTTLSDSGGNPIVFGSTLAGGSKSLTILDDLVPSFGDTVSGLVNVTLAPFTATNTVAVGDSSLQGLAGADTQYDFVAGPPGSGVYLLLGSALSGTLTIGTGSDTGAVTMTAFSPTANLALVNGGAGSITVAGDYSGTGSLALASGSGGISVATSTVATTGGQSYSGNFGVGANALLEATGTNASVTFRGGTLSYSSGFALAALATGSIDVDGSIQNAGSGAINLVAGWDGTAPNSASDVSNLIGGNHYGARGGTVLVGDGNQIAVVAVGTAGGTTTVLGSNITLQGSNDGRTTGAGAQIGFNTFTTQVSTTGAITVDALGTLSLSGGNAAGAFAQIGHGGYNSDVGASPSGALTNAGAITVTAASVSLQGGGQSDAYAQIGHGGDSSFAAAVTAGEFGDSGTISVTTTSGNISLVGGGGDQSYVQIGHGGYETAESATAGDFVLNGDINVESAGAITIESGSESFAYAQIGHGGVQALSGNYVETAITSTGNITVGAVGAITLSGNNSTGGAAYVQIGTGGWESFFNASFQTTSPTAGGTIGISGGISVTGASVNLQAGVGGGDDYAQIGHGGDTALGGANNTATGQTLSPSIGVSGAISVVATSGAVTLQGSSDIDGYAQIGHGGYQAAGNATLDALAVGGSITVTANTSVSLSGGSFSSYAQIGHGGDAFLLNPTNASAPATVSGDISVGASSGVSLTGGNSGSGTGYAQIGLGDYSGTGSAISAQGNVNLTAGSSGTLAITAGTDGAVIGQATAGGTVTNSAVDITAQQVLASGALTLGDATSYTVASSAGQTYSGAVTLGANTTLSDSGGSAIDFDSTVDGTFALKVDTTGMTTFGGNVGAGTALASLVVTGAASFTYGDYWDAAIVTTNGDQTYSGTVTLGSTGTTYFAGNTVTFGGTVIDNSNCGGYSCGSLDTTGVATTVLSGGSVTMGGGQDYGKLILGTDTTISSTNFSYITFHGTVDSAATTNNSLSVDNSYQVSFDDAVGGRVPLSSLSIGPVSGVGSVTLGNVTTVGAQSYEIFRLVGSTITLNGNLVTAGGAINFNQTAFGGSQIVLGNNVTIDTTNGGANPSGGNVGIYYDTVNATTAGGQGLTINAGTAGSVLFAAGAPSPASTVGVGTALSSFSVTAGSIADLMGVTTTGAQSYTVGASGGANLWGTLTTSGGASGAITFTGPGSTPTALTLNGQVLFDTTNGGNVLAGGDVVVNGTIDNYGNPGQYNQWLTITAGTSGNVTFGGTIGNNSPVTTLSVSAGTLTALSGIATSGTQIYDLATSAIFDGVLNGQAISATAPAITIASAATTGGQVYTGNVTLNGTLSDNSLIEVSGNLQVGATQANLTLPGTLGGAIIVTGTIGSTSAGTLNISAGQGLFFENNYTLPAASFTSNGATVNLISTGNAFTQILSGTVDASTINPNDHLLLTGNSAVTLVNTSGAAIVTRAIDDVPGQTTGLSIVQTLGGNGVSLGTIGGVFALSSLSITTPASEGVIIAGGIGSSIVAGITGTTTLNTANVISSSTQNYGGAIVLSGVSTTIASTSGNVIFGGTIDGTNALTVMALAGNVTFGGNVGGVTALSSLIVDASNISLQGVTTSGGQYYLTAGANNTAVTLNGNLTVNGASDIYIDGYVNLDQQTIALTTNGTISSGNIIVSANGVNPDPSVYTTLNVSAGSGLAVIYPTFFGLLPNGPDTVAGFDLDILSSGNALTTTVSGTVGITNGTITGTAGDHIFLSGNTTILDSTGAVNVVQSIDSVPGQANTLTVAITGTGTGVSLGGTVGDLNGLGFWNGSSSPTASISSVTVTSNVTSGTVILPSIGSPIAQGVTGTFSASSSAGQTLALTLNGEINAGGAITIGGSGSGTVAATLGSNTVLDTTDFGQQGGAAIAITGTINGMNGGGQSLTVMPGSSGVTLNGVIGTGTPLAALTVEGTTTLGAATTSIMTSGYQFYDGTVALSGSSTFGTTNSLVDFEGAVSSAGSGTRTMTVTAGSGGVVFNGLALTALTVSNTSGQETLDTGTYNVTTGNNSLGSGTGGLVLDGVVSLSRATTFSGGATLGGNTTLSGTSGVTTTGNIVGPFNFDAADGTLTLSAGTTTINTNAGNGVVTLGPVSGSGKTLAISSGSGGVTFDGLTLAALNVTTSGVETLAAGTYSIGTGTYAFGAVSLNGAIVLEQATNFGATTLTGNTTLTDSAGTVGFTSTVNGANALTVQGNASFGTTVGTTGIALSSLLVTGTTTFGANATTIDTSGSQTYSGAVTLGATTTTLITTSGGLVTVGAINAASDTLSISNGSGGETFNGLTLAALSTTGGTETLDAGTYAIGPSAGTYTFGAISLNGAIGLGQATNFGAVKLGSATTLTDSGGTVGFTSTVTGANALLVSGNASFGGTVGSSATKLTSVGVTGSSTLSGGSVITSGSQTYSGAITLGATTTTLATSNGLVTLGAALSAPSDTLSISSGGSGGVTFNGVTLKALTLTTSGPETLNAGTYAVVTSSGLFTLGSTTKLNGALNFSQATTFSGAVTIGSAGTTVTDTTGALNFLNTINAASAGQDDLTVNAGNTGVVTITGSIGNIAPLSSLAITAGAVGYIAAVTTTGSQTYDVGTAVTPPGGSPPGIQLEQGNFVTSGGAISFTGLSGGQTAVTINGPLTFDTTKGGTVAAGNNVSINGTIDDYPVSAQSLTITAGTAGVVSLGGTVGGTTPITKFSVTGNTIDISANVTTSGLQSYGGAIVLLQSAVLKDAKSGTTITFNGTINDSSAGTEGLTVSANASFGGTIGATSALSSLAVTGTTVLNGATIDTTGGQTYTGAVTLGTNDTLSSTSGGTIGFGSTVTGGDALTISGNTSFGSTVGATGTALTSLLVTGSTTLGSSATTIKTSGGQTYSGAVTLGASTTFTTTSSTGTVTFDAAVSGSGDTLTVAPGSSGGVIFSGLTLRTLTVTGTTVTDTLDAGTYTIGTGSPVSFGAVTLNGSGGTITLSQATNFTGATTLGSDTTVSDTAGAVGFTSTVNGAHALAVSGNASFGSTVGTTGTALTSLLVTGTTTLGANATTIKTSGAQTYGGAVTLGASTTFTTTSSTGAIAFDAAVSGSSDTLIINSGTGGATFSGLTISALTLNTTGTETLTTGTYNIGSANVFGLGGSGAIQVITNGTLTLSELTTFSGGFTLGGNTTLSGTLGVTLTGNVTGPFAFSATGETIALTSGSTTINTGVGSGAVTLGQVSGSGNTLTVSTGSGNTSFAGLTLGAFTINSTGTETLNTGTYNITGGNVFGEGGSGAIPVTTNGTLTLSQPTTFSGAVTLGSNTTLSGGTGTVTFDSTVDGGFALNVNTSGLTSFDQNVGVNAALATLSVSGPSAFGLTQSNMRVNTNGNVIGAQSYGGPVTLDSGTTFDVAGTTSSATFGSTIDSANGGSSHGLTISGNVTFNGSLGSVVGLSSVQMQSGVATFNASGGAITVTTTSANVTSNYLATVFEGSTTFVYAGTAPFQTGADVVEFGGAVNSAGTGPAGAVTVTNSSSNGGNLGSVDFTQSVGATTALGSITVDGAAVFSSGATRVITTGAQSYGATTVSGTNTTFTSSSGNGNISFASLTGGSASDNVTLGLGTGTLNVAGGTSTLATLAVLSAQQATFGGAVNIGTLNLTAGAGGVSFGGLNLTTLSLSTGGSETLNTGTYTIGSGDTFGSAGLNAIPVVTSGTLTFGSAATFSGAVTLGSDTTLSGGAGNNTITFANTITGGGNNLLVSTGGAVSLAATVGGLASFTIDPGPGAVTISAPSITTAGPQLYEHPVVLATGTTLTDSSGSSITFDDTVDGPFNLTVNEAGTTSFLAAVGGNAPLAGLTMASSAGTTDISGATVITSGGQIYSGTVTLGATTTSLDTTNAPVTLGQVNGGADTLDISTGTGGATFNGLTLAALNVTTTGSETINGGTYSIGTGTYAFGLVTLNGAILLEQATNFGAATLGSDTTIADSTGTVGFTSTLDGGHALTVSGNASFGGVVGGGTALTSLAIGNGSAVFGGNVSAGNLTTQAIDFGSAAGQLIATAGSQTYNGAVTLGATNGTLTLDADSDVIFNGNIASTATGITSNLTVNAGRNISLGSSVGYVDPAGLLAFTANWSGASAANRGSGAGNIIEASTASTVIASYAGTGSTSRGISLSVDQAGVEAGNITTGALLSFGPTATSTGKSGGTVTVSDGSGTVTVGVISAFGSAAVNGAGGKGGSVTITAASIDLTGKGIGQTIPLSFDTPIITPATPGIYVQGGAGAGSGVDNGGAGGTITLNGAVALGTPDGTHLTQTFNVLPGLGSGTGVAGLAGSLDFNGTVDSDPLAGAAINLTALGGNVTFGGSVGQTHRLGAISLPNVTGALFVDGNVTAASLTNSGSTTVDVSGGAVIVTTAGQIYSKSVSLGSDATFQDSSVSGVDFASFVDNGSTARNLTVSGNTTFGSTVGGLGALAGIDATGKTVIDAVAVSTTGDQTYGGAVTLGVDSILNGSLISFDSTVDGGHALTVSGAASFGGVVGGGTALTGLTVTGSASLDAAATEVLTSGAEQFGATTVAASSTRFDTTGNGNAAGAGIAFASLSGLVGTENVVLDAGTSGAILISGTVSQLNTLELVNAGSATFDGAVTLTNLTIDANGNANESVALLGAGTNVTNAVTFLNEGGVTLDAGGGGTETFAGGLTSTASTTTLGGTIATTSIGQSYGPVMLAADTVLNGGANDVIFGSTINGAHALTVNSGAVTHFDGAVNIASIAANGGGSTVFDVGSGSIATSGGQTYNDAVFLAADTTLRGTQVSFNSTLDGDHALTVSGPASFGGAVGGGTALTSLGVTGTSALNGGTVDTTNGQLYSDAVTLGAATTLNGGSGNVTFGSTVEGAYALTVDSGGVTQFDCAVDIASLTASGGGSTVFDVGSGSILTSGGQTYNDAVFLAADTTLSGTHVSFNSTVDGGYALTVSGAASFGGAVGGGTALTSLGVSGTSALDGGTVDTTNGQLYSDAVTLGAATTLNGGSGNVTFGSTVDGAYALTVTSGAVTQFDGAVNIASITASGGGSTVFDVGSGSILTSGGQTYNDAVFLAADTTLSGTQVSFNSTVDGGYALTVSGAASFGGVVGGGTALTSLGVTGTSALNGGTVDTTNGQTYSGAVTLGSDNTLTGSLISFGSTVDGGYALTVSGAASFGGVVGGGTALTSLGVTGTSALNGGTVTSAFQLYQGAVTLGADTTLNGTLIGFGSTIDGAYALTISADLSLFTGAVGSSTPLTSLDVAGGALFGGGSIATSGDITFAGSLALFGDATFTTNGSAVTFNAITGPGDNLTINLGTHGINGSVNFDGEVGTSAMPLGILTVSGLGTGGSFTIAPLIDVYVGQTNITLPGGSINFGTTLDSSGPVIVDAANISGDINDAGSLNVNNAVTFNVDGMIGGTNGIADVIFTGTLPTGSFNGIPVGLSAIIAGQQNAGSTADESQLLLTNALGQALADPNGSLAGTVNPASINPAAGCDNSAAQNGQSCQAPTAPGADTGYANAFLAGNQL